VRYSIRTITAPGAIPLPFAVDDAFLRASMRVDPTGDGTFDTAQAALISAQVRAAMDFVERFTGQVLTARILEMASDAFPCLPELIALPRDPVTAITSIIYTDASAGNPVTMDGAAWRWSDSSPDVILPAFRTAWPVAARERGSVLVRFEAGYDPDLAPPALIAAVKMMARHLFDNPGAVQAGDRAAAIEMPLGVRDLCMPFRRMIG
jgi:uncharacterized phiE125 gp8 family phage protein